MNPNLSVLIITHTFPPQAEAGVIRVASFCRYLPAYGIRPIVLTVREHHYTKRDDSFPPFEGVTIRRTTVLPSPLGLYARLKALFDSGRTSKQAAQSLPTIPPASPLRQYLLLLLQTPDPYWNWYLPAVHAAKKLVREEKVAAIFSSGPPWISHMVARRVKRQFGVPWLADFRDPWTSTLAWQELPGWRQRLDLSLESGCVREADLVICNTERMRKEMASRFSDLSPARFVTLTNGFNEAPRFTPPPALSTGARIVIHLGKIYGQRRLDPFCAALSQLVKERRLDPDTIKVRFVGNIAPALEAGARAAAPELFQAGCIEFRPRVTWKEAQEALWGAHLLLLVQGGYNLQIPAKFYEYLVTGKPIFAVAEEGALTDIIESTGSGVSVAPKDADAIANQFMRALELPSRSLEEVERISRDFHYRSLTKRLAQWMKEVAETAAVSQRL